MSRTDLWAQFRFSVIGSLLSAPPAAGELRQALKALSDRIWKHPTRQQPLRLRFSTIERWYYHARTAENPVAALRSTPRRDSGQQRSLSPELKAAIRAQYLEHSDWSAKLHYDNLVVVVKQDARLGRLPSYPTVVRFLRVNGLERTARRATRGRPGLQAARDRHEQRETRSYEVEHVGGLWHLDFHTARHVAVIRSDGSWIKPSILGVLDDHSRVCCHGQWYLNETAQNLAHGLGQAFLKRGLPRAMLMDNGSAMIACEIQQGLAQLGIQLEYTLPYSPQQNGKQEHFWAVLEGRLMALVHNLQELKLEDLNLFTQAWIERDYHQAHHSELCATPLERFRSAPTVLRPASTDLVRDAFLQRVTRNARRSDGTLSLEGVRFEIPNRFRHLRRLPLRYAQWDLSRALLVDERTGTVLAPIYPLDRTANADGRRRSIEPVSTTTQLPSGKLPALLKKLVAEYSATGLPPAFLTPEHEKE